jgi:uncharacterized protein (DUF885 family)
MTACLLIAAMAGLCAGGTGLLALDAPPTTPATPTTPTTPASAADRLKALLDEHVEQRLRDDPESASTRGDRRYNALLRDESPEAYAARRAAHRDRLERLKAIDVAALDEADRLNAGLLRGELERSIEWERFSPEQIPMDDRRGPAVWLPQLGSRVPMSTEQDRADYVARLEAIPAYLDQMIVQMRAGLAAGRVPPKVTVTRVAEQAREHAKMQIWGRSDLSAFFDPLKGRPDGDALKERARAALKGPVAEAFGRLADFLEKEYVPACRDTIGASQGVDGPALYELALRDQTTTNLSADEIHAIGLKEVARIRGQMFRVIARSDFPKKDALKGDELFAAFTEYLRTDPRFYYTSADDLLNSYRAIAKRADAELPRFFRLLPRNPYGVRAMPEFAAPTSPTAYYYSGSLKSGVAGFFIANTYRLDQRPKYEMIPLTLHEAMPGHHLERALTEELEGLHPLRSMLSFTGFVEGWGLYSERLGLEMEGPILTEKQLDDGLGLGMYEDPYDDFGRLSFEMWRALRLVVDTGIHAKGWTRDRAIEYMAANSALTRVNIEREVDRYIAWPGQACAYKLGEIKIRELRARAEERLGATFDIRAFHDAILGAGPLPLDVLETRVNEWIAGGGK